MKKSSPDRSAPRAVKFSLLLVIAVFAVTAGGLYGFGRLHRLTTSDEPPHQEAGASVRSVKTVRTIEELVEESLHLSGELHAYEDARLSFRVPGYVSKLHFQPGDPVEAGQTLAELDTTDFLLAVHHAEAELQQARAVLGLSAGDTRNPNPQNSSAVIRAHAELQEAERHANRIRELRARESASQSELDAAETAYLVARHSYQEAVETSLEQEAVLRMRETQVEQARLNLKYATLTAPFTGFIQEKLTGPGAFLDVADPVYHLVRKDILRLRVEISERDVHGVSPGQTLRFRFADGGEGHGARLTRLLPQLEADTRVLIGEADIENTGGWHPGVFVRVELVTGEPSPAITLPSRAITSFVGIYRVLVVEEGVAAAREIQPGRRIGDRTVILQGLDQGEEVILDPGEVRSGDPVHAIPDA